MKDQRASLDQLSVLYRAASRLKQRTSVDLGEG